MGSRTTTKHTGALTQSAWAALDDDQLATLPADQVADAVQRLLSLKIGPAHASEIRVLVASMMDADEHVNRLAGTPSDITDRLALESRIQDLRARAHRHVLNAPMLTSAAVASVVGASDANPRQAASGPRRRGRLLGLPQGNTYVFPQFQFDVDARRIHPVVERINVQLDALGDPWGVASWWLSPTPRLHGQTPADLVGADRDADLQALATAEAGE